MPEEAPVIEPEDRPGVGELVADDTPPQPVGAIVADQDQDVPR